MTVIPVKLVPAKAGSGNDGKRFVGLPRRPTPIELRLAPNLCWTLRNDIKAVFLLPQG